jgi:P pilus assembly/Cpx signaling pathway, periplasmic inhibitor/zinc-resistance associated protein
MKNLARIALFSAVTVLFSSSALAASVTGEDAAPAPSQDPVVQHLKLSTDQVTRIQALHQQLDNNIEKIKVDGFKDGAITDMFRSGKWDDTTVKQQLAAFSQLDQQVRYYRVKYYFDINQILTPEQRQQVKQDLIQALN